MTRRLFTAQTPDGEGPEAARLFDDRWRWGAFAAPLLWSLWTGSWLAGAGAFGAYLASAALALADQIPVAVAVEIALRLFFGWEGGAIARADRAARGWREIALVEAGSREEAEARFVEEVAG